MFQVEKINTILKAAEVEVEPYWPGLFAKAASGLDLKAIVCNVGSGVGTGGGAGGAAPAAAAASEGKLINLELQPDLSGTPLLYIHTHTHTHTYIYIYQEYVETCLFT